MAAKTDGKAMAIDLSSTYSCVEVWQNDRVEVILNDQGNLTTHPSVALGDTQQQIDDEAKNQVEMNPTNHPSIGQWFSHPCVTVSNPLPSIACKVVAGPLNGSFPYPTIDLWSSSIDPSSRRSHSWPQ